MPKKNSPALEIVSVDKRIEEAQELKRVFTQIIEEKVAEATGGPDALFQPFFSGKRMLAEIRKVQSVAEQAKFTYYFERWGCMGGCGATAETVAHGGLGFCRTCNRRIRERLRTIVREHTAKADEMQSFSDAVNLARASLTPSNRMLPSAFDSKKETHYYKHGEAAKLAGIDPKTLYVWLRNGGATPSIRLSANKWLWTDADIEELRALKAKNRSLHNSEASRARWAKKEISL